VGTRNTGLVGYLDNNGQQTFTRSAVGSGLTNIQAVEVFDNDNDGDLDIITGSTSGRVDYFASDCCRNPFA
jgi:hypothetical protein